MDSRMQQRYVSLSNGLSAAAVAAMSAHMATQTFAPPPVKSERVEGDMMHGPDGFVAPGSYLLSNSSDNVANGEQNTTTSGMLDTFGPFPECFHEPPSYSDWTSGTSGTPEMLQAGPQNLGEDVAQPHQELPGMFSEAMLANTMASGIDEMTALNSGVAAMQPFQQWPQNDDVPMTFLGGMELQRLYDAAVLQHSMPSQESAQNDLTYFTPQQQSLQPPYQAQAAAMPFGPQQQWQTNPTVFSTQQGHMLQPQHHIQAHTMQSVPHRQWQTNPAVFSIPQQGHMLQQNLFQTATMPYGPYQPVAPNQGVVSRARRPPRSTSQQAPVAEEVRHDCPYKREHSCKKTFSNPTHAKRHGEGHVSTTRYPCTYCDRTFSRKDNRKTHEQAHFKKGRIAKKDEKLGRVAKK